MKALLLCPGPSLSAHKPRPADLAIGVNAAAMLYVCDWWAAIDWSYVREHGRDVMGQPNLLTSGQTVAAMAGRMFWSGIVRPVESFIDSWDGRMIGWTCYTATAALVFAGVAGANIVEVVGADMSGTKDAGGDDTPATRTPERWQREREIWTATIAMLNAHNIEVIHGGV